MSSPRETRTSGSVTPWLTPLSPRWEGKKGLWSVLTCYKCSSITHTLEDKGNWSLVESCRVIFYPLSGWFNLIRVLKLTSCLGKLNSSIYKRKNQPNKQKNTYWKQNRKQKIGSLESWQNKQNEICGLSLPSYFTSYPHIIPLFNISTPRYTLFVSYWCNSPMNYLFF